MERLNEKIDEGKMFNFAPMIFFHSAAPHPENASHFLSLSPAEPVQSAESAKYRARDVNGEREQNPARLRKPHVAKNQPQPGCCIPQF